jgi:uncharacterized membrane protein
MLTIHPPTTNGALGVRFADSACASETRFTTFFQSVSVRLIDRIPSVFVHYNRIDRHFLKLPKNVKLVSDDSVTSGLSIIEDLTSFLEILSKQVPNALPALVIPRSAQQM